MSQPPTPDGVPLPSAVPAPLPVAVAEASATLSYASPDLGYEVRAIGMAKRRVIWAFLITLLAIFGGVTLCVAVRNARFSGIVMIVAIYGSAATLMVSVYRLSAAMGHGMVRRIFYVLLMMVPYLNVLFVFQINSQATKTLRDHRVRVGVMGARLSDLP